MSPAVRRRVHRVTAPAVVAVALLGVWELAVRWSGVEKFVLPAPSDVLGAAVRTAPELGPHTLTTLAEAGLGLVVGSAVGIVLAVVVGALPAVADAVYPLVTLTQTVPTVVLAPLLVIWAGFGIVPKVILVALTVFFPVLVAAVTAMSTVAGEHADMVSGLGGSRRHVFWFVQLPACVPGALGGLRVAVTYTMGAAVVAEYLAGSSGLGVFIQRSRKVFAVDQIFVAVLVIAVVTGLLFLLVDSLARSATPWQRAAPRRGTASLSVGGRL